MRMSCNCIEQTDISRDAFMDYSGNREQADHRRDESLAAPPRSFDGDCTDSCSGGGNDGATRRRGKVPTLRRAASVTVPPGHGLARPRRLDFSDLDLPECLLIKPIRLWLHGVENWSLVGMQYKAQFGPEAAPTARALTALFIVWGWFELAALVCLGFDATLRPGDLLFLTMGPAPLRVGEILVYALPGRSIPIVHRIIKVSASELCNATLQDGGRVFVQDMYM